MAIASMDDGGRSLEPRRWRKRIFPRILQEDPSLGHLILAPGDSADF